MAGPLIGPTSLWARPDRFETSLGAHAKGAQRARPPRYDPKMAFEWWGTREPLEHRIFKELGRGLGFGVGCVIGLGGSLPFLMQPRPGQQGLDWLVMYLFVATPVALLISMVVGFVGLLIGGQIGSRYDLKLAPDDPSPEAVLRRRLATGWRILTVVAIAAVLLKYLMQMASR